MLPIKIISVVGARPNFMKIAPFVKAIEGHNARHPNKPVRHILVHTGQHYDMRMSEGFFRCLSIPDPDINLEIGSGTHAEQVGQTMIAFEKVLLQERPDWVVVVGDVNATLACSVTAKKLCLKVCHIEAGLRSGDITMPEEINRLVTDRLSDLLLTPDRLSNENLRREGVPDEKICFVGNIMIDTLEANREKAGNLDPAAILRENLLMPGAGCPALDGGYALLTMHRPSNVDQKEVLEPILNFLTDEVAVRMPVIWPIHPRTRKMLQTFSLWSKAMSCSNLVLLHPIGYHEMLRLNMQATVMLTDSGGLQEECCVLGTPCLTLRWNTERPVTLKEHGGASVLVGNNVGRIRNEFLIALELDRTPQRPDLWDGKAAVRCLEALLRE
ncbi:UDP-N-acetylglucosamine 2-epimerase (non-hydrolyzing) [Desulfomicrobium sp. ZS1]|uniref:non-hydrolyzing UDP-N-acetylglucosamine 2-epimerase n=1 Tax=Desulfomicrobium sp. ZS1 TaxID=2952228 RepID=UPI0020B1CC0C|nr:UDP-N-acetylglucosamine 2-epimerase (non-hydrolyzing) [Desulfomicrobium sp. ZS1]UTF50720.1 UDP-N-acetylglucosamine 2-epimerase (non-hydrolyzing) [Desulfomicrobium sp. ZS1]